MTPILIFSFRKQSNKDHYAFQVSDETRRKVASKHRQVNPLPRNDPSGPSAPIGKAKFIFYIKIWRKRAIMQDSHGVLSDNVSLPPILKMHLIFGVEKYFLKDKK